MGVILALSDESKWSEKMAHCPIKKASIALAESDDELDVLVDRFSRAVMSRHIDGGDVVLLMFALDSKKTLMSPDCRERYEEQRRLLFVEIERGHEYLSRNSRLDGFLSLIFPRVRKVLEMGFATKKQLGEIRVAVAEAKAKVEANNDSFGAPRTAAPSPPLSKRRGHD